MREERRRGRIRGARRGWTGKKKGGGTVTVRRREKEAPAERELIGPSRGDIFLEQGKNRRG